MSDTKDPSPAARRGAAVLKSLAVAAENYLLLERTYRESDESVSDLIRMREARELLQDKVNLVLRPHDVARHNLHSRSSVVRAERERPRNVNLRGEGE